MNYIIIGICVAVALAFVALCMYNIPPPNNDTPGVYQPVKLPTMDRSFPGDDRHDLPPVTAEISGLSDDKRAAMREEYTPSDVVKAFTKADQTETALVKALAKNNHLDHMPFGDAIDYLAQKGNNPNPLGDWRKTIIKDIICKSNPNPFYAEQWLCLTDDCAVESEHRLMFLLFALEADRYVET